MSERSQVLNDLSQEELVALADSKLAPSAQSRLDELLERNSEGNLNQQDQQELDELLAKVDQLTILKTRARYTLHQLAGAAGV